MNALVAHIYFLPSDKTMAEAGTLVKLMYKHQTVSLIYLRPLGPLTKLGIMLDEHYNNSKQNQKSLECIQICSSMGKVRGKELLFMETKFFLLRIFSLSIWEKMFSFRMT